MELTLEALGLTKEELQERVVERMAEKMLRETGVEEECEGGSGLFVDLTAMIRERVDAGVKKIADDVVAPKVNEQIEAIILQKTNDWGEPADEKSMTFREYLIKRAEVWMNESVNYEGKTSAETRRFGGSFSASGARLAFMVDKHLHYEIENAMEEALKIANSAISTGIQETVKVKLEEVVKGLKTTVTVKR